MPINTFLKTSQSDFATAAASFRVLCQPMHHSRHTGSMQYVRKAVTVLLLLFAVQLQCISTGHLACMFMREELGRGKGSSPAKQPSMHFYFQHTLCCSFDGLQPSNFPDSSQKWLESTAYAGICSQQAF